MMDERASECLHLATTLAQITRERLAIEQSKEALADKLYQLKKGSGGTYDDELMVQENIFQIISSQALALGYAQKTPYFSRIDFTPEGQSLSSYYLGKHGVMDADTLQSIVVDWRSPIANLYYAGQVGEASYEAPESVVHGDLSLKRIFTIEDQSLVHMLDVDIMAQDKMLLDALAATTTERLKEVVTTIQAEQNAIIRHPMRVPLIVQGVAGSGKTTIALHRIAYLLYAHADTLSPQQMMILAPNPLFLQYISSVLPELGVENAHQTTFPQLSLQLLGKYAPSLRTGERLDDLLHDPVHAQSMRTLCRTKGSIAFGHDLQAFIDRLEQTILPDAPILFGPVTILRGEEVRSMFLQDLAPFPWRRRIEELCKIVKNNLKRTAIPALTQAIEDACVKRADTLRKLPEGVDKRERLTTLYHARDAHIKEITLQAKTFVQNIPKLFPTLDPFALYQQFLQEQGLPPIQGKKVDIEDLPALLLLEKALGGFPNKPKLRHIVIDEAQDNSALSLYALQDIFNAGYTLVGDMGQGIYRYRGMDSWDEALEVLPKSAIKFLRVSYRSTVEIMHYANEIAAAYPYPGQILAQPVLRHSDPPTLLYPTDEAERLSLLQTAITRYQQKSYQSIAILALDTPSAKALHKQLLHAGIDTYLLDAQANAYQGGLLVAAATSVKGLEFEAVILQNASAFPSDATGARLLYVCATRSMHALTVLH